MVNIHSLTELNYSLATDATPTVVHNICELVNALLELRELAPSGSAEMAIIDEALNTFGVRPWELKFLSR